MSDRNTLVSLWRTAVPFVAGFLVVQAARLGIELDNATVVAGLTLVAGHVYHHVARRLENWLGSKWGWLLGWPQAPVYRSDRGREKMGTPSD